VRGRRRAIGRGGVGKARFGDLPKRVLPTPPVRRQADVA